MERGQAQNESNELLNELNEFKGLIKFEDELSVELTFGEV